MYGIRYLDSIKRVLEYTRKRGSGYRFSDQLWAQSYQNIAFCPDFSFEAKIEADRIIVWLDEDNWSDENFPKRLQTFRRQGVEFKFWEDIRSYKKLIRL